MEQEAFQLILLDKVRRLERQLQKQKPIVGWAQRHIPKLWFEERNGKDGESGDVLVIGNQAENIWIMIAKDTYCVTDGWAHWTKRRKVELVVSDHALSIRHVRVYDHEPWRSCCYSSIKGDQAEFWHNEWGRKLYPLECKAHVDAMLLEAAKRFGWEVLLPEKEGSLAPSFDGK